ncbi:hypothetical protein [Chitinophaga sp. 212800010-3]|uniref:hypothetical protein n=1 Tax=unclassified Chitinophaga TaxID=2619133 RepID=UPI002DF274FC|nr:hypothetical protein [Chitinophaga sp. 212800010-3]
MFNIRAFKKPVNHTGFNELPATGIKPCISFLAPEYVVSLHSGRLAAGILFCTKITGR